MKLNNKIDGKSVFYCSVCKKQIEMNESVYITDEPECLGEGNVAHFFCVMDLLQRNFEQTHRVVKIRLNECDNAKSIVLEEKSGEWVCF